MSSYSVQYYLLGRGSGDDEEGGSPRGERDESFLPNGKFSSSNQLNPFVRGICGAHGGCETAEVRDIPGIGEGRGLRRGPIKTVEEVFSGQPQSFRHQRRPVDDCSPERGGIAQDGGTRGGTFLAAEKARAGLRHAAV